jgi:hypothetical protein
MLLHFIYQMRLQSHAFRHFKFCSRHCPPHAQLLFIAELNMHCVV